MTRTTIDLDPTVLSELKERARRERKSMGALGSQLLSRALAEPDRADSDFEWPARDMGEPLVDLEDKESVQRILDGIDG